MHVKLVSQLKFDAMCSIFRVKNELCCQRYIRMIVVVGLYQLEFLSQVKLHAIYVMNFIL